jgi:hypothetical protein
MSRALESLRTVRESEEAAARDRLAEEIRAQATLDAALHDARDALARADALLTEANAIAVADAAERAARDAYVSRRRRERSSAAAHHEAACRRADDQARRVDEARAALASAHADKRVTEARIERDEDERRREAERREEDEAADRPR